MKFGLLKATILHHLVQQRKIDRDRAYYYEEDDAKKWGVTLHQVEDALQSLKSESLVKPHYNNIRTDSGIKGVWAYSATPEGMEWDDEYGLGADQNDTGYDRDATGHLIDQKHKDSLLAEFENSTQSPKSLIRIDLDNFKPINEEYGHDAGDKVLDAVYRQIALAVQGYAAAIRAGGDEVIVLLPNFDSSQALATARRISSAIKSTFVSYDGHDLNLSASIGVATHPEDGEGGLDKTADDRQRIAKREGKGKVVATDTES